MKAINLLHFVLGVSTYSFCVADPVSGGLGRCDAAHQLVLAQDPYSGSASRLLQISKFSETHRRFTQGYPSWVTSLNGPSPPNRAYIGGKLPIIVIKACDPTSCGSSRAYIGYDEGSGIWGARVLVGPQVTELGAPVPGSAVMQVVPDDIAPALICAQNLDATGGRR